MEKTKVKQSPWKRILLIIALVLLVFSLALSLFSKNVVYKEIIPLKVTVDNKIGLSLSTEELNFGTLMQGQAATKGLDLENSFSSPLNVRISLDKGNISSFVYGENNFLISSNEQLLYNVSLVIPADAEKGFYEGNLIIEFLK